MSTVVTISLIANFCVCAIMGPKSASGAPEDSLVSIDTSLVHAFEELSAAKSVRDTINAYNTIGWYYYDRREFDKAVDMFRNALDVSISIRNKQSTANCYINLADAMAQMGLYNESNDYNHKALNIFYETYNQEGISNVSKTIGLMCINHHLYKTAAEYLNRALEIDTVMNIRTGGNNATDVAFDYLYLGHAELSKYFDTYVDSLLQHAKAENLKAHSMMLKLNNKIGIAYSAKNLMDIYLETAKSTSGKARRHQLDSSLMFHAKGKKIVTELNITPLLTDFTIWEAKYAIETGQFEQAEKMLEQVDVAIRKGLPDSYKIDYGYTMADYYEAIGKYRRAYDWTDRTSKLEKQNMNREFAVQSAKMSVRNDFADILQQREIDREREYIKRREQEIRYVIITATAAMVLILIAVLAAIVMKILKRRRKLEKKLKIRNEELELQKDQLECINDQIVSSINFAHHLQTSILPTDEQMNAMFGDMLILWRPLDVVSGDFYWATQSGGRKLITIADCTGHGVPGGFMSMLGVSLLSDITQMQDFKDGTMTAGNVLDIMRDKVVEALRQSEESSMALDGMDMALCIIDTEARQMQYAGAFRPLVMVRDGQLIERKGDKMPVSYLSANPRPFVTHTIDIADGDIIYIFSDGITDQFGYGATGKEQKFSLRRLLGLLEENAGKSFDEQKNVLVNSIDDWRAPVAKKSLNQTDDIILLGFRITEK